MDIEDDDKQHQHVGVEWNRADKFFQQDAGSLSFARTGSEKCRCEGEGTAGYHESVTDIEKTGDDHAARTEKVLYER